VRDAVRVRFAPSPTGHLHVGGARTALFNWLFAKQRGGSFVLRIEDTDTVRSSRDFEGAALEDLRWLGLTWDEGPDVGGELGPYRQSDRLETYAEHAARLVAGGKAFRCYCTDEELESKRKEALARGRVPQYDGACRDLSEGERAALEAGGARPSIRLSRPTRDVSFVDLVRGEVTFASEMLGDFVIMRSDGRPTYNFAVVVDDALMRISHVIRAEEHLPNTMRQLLVYESLGYDAPEFAHVSLVVDKDRSKLSKRRGATSVAEFREAGYLPGALVNYLALLGWSPPDGREIMSLDDLAEAFDLERVSPSPAAFDEEKLDWVNAHHIREEPVGRVALLAGPFAEEAGLRVDDAARFERMVELARDGLRRLSDLPDAIAFLVGESVAMQDDASEWVRREGSRAVIGRLLASVVAGEGDLSADSFTRTLKEVGGGLGVKGKDLFMPVRAALTGRTHGPALGEVAAVLGRDVTAARLARFAGEPGEGADQ
jgi:nondiscriminating glutamyl-tRNA synthetase